MSKFYIKRRKYWKYGRYWAKRRYRKKKTRYVNATSRSRCSIKVQDHATLTVKVPGLQTESEVGCLNPVAMKVSPTNIASTELCYPTSTWTQDIVQNFVKMYDEVKVDAVAARFTVTNVIGAGGLVPSLRFFTAWDRKGTYNDTYYDASYPTMTKMESLPSCQVAVMANNTGTTVTRAIKASDFFEKFQFFDATSNNNIQGKIRQSTLHAENYRFNLNEAWFSNAAGCFTPTLYFGIQLAENEEDEDVDFEVVVDYTVYYTFRNPIGAALPAEFKNKKKKTVVVSGTAEKEPVAALLRVADDEVEAPVSKRVRPETGAEAVYQVLDENATLIPVEVPTLPS